MSAVHFWHYASGASLMLELFPLSGGPLANPGGDALVEVDADTQPGLYSASIAEALDGDYIARLSSGGVVVWQSIITAAPVISVNSGQFPAILERLSALEHSAGTGAWPVVLTCLDGSDTPVPGARVRVSNGSASYFTTADDAGLAAFSLDDGSYVISAAAPGYACTPLALDVAGAAVTEQLRLEADPIVAPNPSELLVNGFLLCLDETGAPEPDVTITLQLLQGPDRIGLACDTRPRTVHSGADGLAVFEGIVKGARYMLRRGSQRVEFIAGSTDPLPLPAVAGRE